MSDTKSNQWQFEHSVICHADRAFAWSFWTDVANWERLEGKAVEWIKINGDFAAGTTGATKSPSQPAHEWLISAMQPGESAVIDIALDGAVFSNKMSMEALETDKTKITQVFSLSGEKADHYEAGMEMISQTAPQGLQKLSEAIEETHKNES